MQHRRVGGWRAVDVGVDQHVVIEPVDRVVELAAAIDPRYELLVRFAAYTGLRAGELVALRIRHLNLLRGRCEVGESATEVDGRLVWGPTKTYARRTVHLPRFLCDQLAAYLAERPHGPDDLVFTAAQGGPLREQKFVAGIFKPAAAQAGLPHRLRFHDLRHTCASLLIAQGASVKAVQAQLGHASATVTLDRYGHLFPDELQRLADRLQDAYADAVTDPARTKAGETMLRERKGAGQRPAPGGGGGETRTPVPRRRPRDSPSAAAGSGSDPGCPAATLPGPSQSEMFPRRALASRLG
jgi:Phage integrase family